MGEIADPPPIPSNPESNPAITPIIESGIYRILYSSSLISFFLKKRNINPEKIRNPIKRIKIISVGIYCDIRAPTIADRNENTMMGIPTLKSRRLFLILEMLAPVRLMILLNRPTGFATLIGMPNETRMGMIIMAPPTPPRENINAAINEIRAIKYSTF